MKKLANFLLGAIIGGAVGAVAALLLTPASGDKLRGDIQDYIDTTREEVRLAGERRRTELEQQLENLRKPQE